MLFKVGIRILGVACPGDTEDNGARFLLFDKTTSKGSMWGTDPRRQAGYVCHPSSRYCLSQAAPSSCSPPCFLSKV
jgi:hypothetical protein